MTNKKKKYYAEGAFFFVVLLDLAYISPEQKGGNAAPLSVLPVRYLQCSMSYAFD